MSRARRDFLLGSGALAAAALLPGCAALPGRGAPRAVVIGGGYGGATAAKYLRMWSGGTLEVLLVEPDAEFVSCPASNLVIGGSRRMGDITRSYAGLAARGVRVIRDEVTAIDADKRRVRLKNCDAIAYDRLVVSP